jgi:hypothetical protein
MPLMFTTLAAALLAAATAATPAPRAAPPAAPAPLAGVWAGDGFTVRATPLGTIVQGQCSWGKIEEPIVPGADGRFRAKGYFNPYMSGYKLSDLARRDQPATFEGQLTGKTMKLTLRIPTKPDRRLVLRQGAKTKFSKCT